MSFYDNEVNVEQYINMSNDYDGSGLIKKLKAYVEEGNTILELGMGSGKDLTILNRTYNATGSDFSEIFINRYLKANPGADILHLDAITLDTNRRFNCIYSNKVLHHLSYENMKMSFNRQSEILTPNGVIFHSFWYGSNIENFDGLLFHQVTETVIEEFIGSQFKILEIQRYTEIEENDSLLGIFKLV